MPVLTRLAAVETTAALAPALMLSPVNSVSIV